ncbi:MAG: metallophosphoesterase [Candidatus Bipolaricaulota bacterium]|nr:metallophosphoesterase [Candidatus Bipolaricaulota bacterium]
MKRVKLLLALLLVAILVASLTLVTIADDTNTGVLRVGIFTDLHAHDTDSPDEGKVMTAYPQRLEACVDAMNAWPADLVVQLGDFVNGAFVMGAALGDPTRIMGILDQAEALYAKLDAPRYYVLGNHDVYDLSKDEFLAHTAATDTVTSFDVGAYHFVILDAQYNKKDEDLAHAFWVVQGNIPQSELDWLANDLAATDKPTIVCVHQRLEVDMDLLSGGPEVLHNKEVQQLIEDSGVVIAVFEGHDHENVHTVINGIHYIEFDQLAAEHDSQPSWAYVTLDPQARTITIVGAGDQSDWDLSY